MVSVSDQLPDAEHTPSPSVADHVLFGVPCFKKKSGPLNERLCGLRGSRSCFDSGRPGPAT